MRGQTSTSRLREACAIAGLAALVLCGFAPEDLKAALQARYAALDAAMNAHDDSAIAAILAPDFTSVDVSGRTETAARMIDEVDRLEPDPNMTSTTTLDELSRQGDTVIVQQRFDMRTTKAGPDGARRKVELDTLSTDTWVKPQAVWLIQRTMTNELSYFVDGVMVANKMRR